MSSDNAAYEGFGGKVGKVFASSEPEWPPVPTAPRGAPNVVVILADDLGFADLGCYGSEIDTPNLDELAATGVRYTNFHVTPMCSPTRASLLTGLNSHLAGVGHVAHSDPGFPGYAMELTDRAATMAEIFRDNGYATMMLGKWHLTKDSHLSDASPKHSWPCQKGFERFYGILDGFTNFHQPHRLYEDNHHVEVDRYPDDYYFTDDLTDRAISMIRDVKANDPSKPFFCYFSHGAVHAPLQAKPADIDRHRGAYDAGWDRIREERYRRQLELGVIAEGTVLPPRNAEPDNDVTAWDELTDQERELFARYMEIFADMVDSVDQSWGRLSDALAEIGELDNTIVVFTSDNGGSREGEANGTSQYFRTLGLQTGGGQFEDVAVDHARLDLMGGPQTLPHYPRGWAMVSSAPFRLYKINTHQGGHQVPLIVSWPAGLDAHGELRTQYQHVTDLLPTLLELTGLAAPTTRGGEELLAPQGFSFAGSLTDAGAASTHTEQYYEMIGHRGYYRDGWGAVTLHHGRTPFGDHEWELYHLAEDPTESRNLAAEHPEKVAELAAAFDEAAWANQVYPLDEGTGLKWVQRPPGDERLAETVTVVPGTPTLERYRSAQLINGRNFTITVRLAGYQRGDGGILVAHGDQGGGYALYVEDGALRYVHNAYGDMTVLDCGAVPPGATEVVADVVNTGGWNLDLAVSVDGNQVATATGLPMITTMAPFEGIDVGIDRRSPVSWEVYERHGPFPYTGALVSVTFAPGELAPDAGVRWIEVLREMGLKFE